MTYFVRVSRVLIAQLGTVFVFIILLKNTEKSTELTRLIRNRDAEIKRNRAIKEVKRLMGES